MKQQINIMAEQLTNIYILKCKQNKYYVGSTHDLDKRLEEHYSGEGSFWTKQYHPIETIEIMENVSPFDEDKYTVLYMSRYGIDNVRGGIFSRMTFDDGLVELLTCMIRNAQGKCLRCGWWGHFAKNCQNKETPLDTRYGTLNKKKSICEMYNFNNTFNEKKEVPKLRCCDNVCDVDEFIEMMKWFP